MTRRAVFWIAFIFGFFVIGGWCLVVWLKPSFAHRPPTILGLGILLVVGFGVTLIVTRNRIK